MRPWQAMLLAVALLATFDYVANDADGIGAVFDWSVRSGRRIAGTIHRFVVTAFGQ
jgi:hypothetical protein